MLLIWNLILIKYVHKVVVVHYLVVTYVRIFLIKQIEIAYHYILIIILFMIKIKEIHLVLFVLILFIAFKWTVEIYQLPILLIFICVLLFQITLKRLETSIFFYILRFVRIEFWFQVVRLSEVTFSQDWIKFFVKLFGALLKVTGILHPFISQLTWTKYGL